MIASFKSKGPLVRIPLIACFWISVGLCAAGCNRASSSEGSKTSTSALDESESVESASGSLALNSKSGEDYLNPTSESYMDGPTEFYLPDSAKVFLSDEDYVEFKSRMDGFLSSFNESEFETHFREFNVPEVFDTDSLFNLYVRMYNQWDSIGVSTRLDRWSFRYISPFYEGDTYDICVAEVDLRHHIYFAKRWTGNYRNFGRPLSSRYPKAQITYMDTSFVNMHGDSIYRRHVVADASRLIFGLRGHLGDPKRSNQIVWLNDGWQLQPNIIAVIDSSAVALAVLHRTEQGTFKQRPLVTGR